MNLESILWTHSKVLNPNPSFRINIEITRIFIKKTVWYYQFRLIPGFNCGAIIQTKRKNDSKQSESYENGLISDVLFMAHDRIASNIAITTFTPSKG